jgi:hypothetical protein
MAKMDPSQYNEFFQNRGASVQVPQPAPGRPGAAGAAGQPQQAKTGDDTAIGAVEAVKKGAFDLFKNVLQRKAEEALSK